EDRPVVRPALAEGDRLVAAVVAALRAAAGVLTGGAPPDLHAIEVARDQHRAALDRWTAEQLRGGRRVEDVLDGLDYDDTLRVVSYLTFLVSGNSATVVGAEPDPGDTAVNVVRTIL